MGVNCCQNCESVQVENMMSKIAYLADYQQSKWPDEQQLHTLLKFSKFYKDNQGQKPLKHKVYNRWFWGVWKEGCPYGIVDSKSVYYEGEFEGQPDGFGKVVYNGGQWEYNGFVSKGKANGKGQIFNKKEGFKFDGEWKESKPYIGTLTLFNMLGSQVQNQQNSQSPTQILGNITILLNHSKPGNIAQINYPDGKIYKGEINKFKYVPEGRGELTFPNKNKYVGDWVLGEMSGEGKFYWSDGSYYDGEYVQGKKHGIGKFYYTSGNYYDGFWKNGKQDGRGILYDRSKNQIKNGIWVNGIYKQLP